MKRTAIALSACALLSMEATNVNARDILGETNPLILNQASDAIVEYLKLEKPLGKGATQPMAEAALRGLVDQYDGTRVSHIFWNICYQRAAYRSDAWASYWDVDVPEKQVVHWPRKYYELHKLGVDDVFSLLIPYSRQRGISPWVSLRMNDMHYHEDPNRMNPFWNEHPEFWTHEKPGFHNGFDFTQPAVREHYLKLVEEAVFRWDIDGVELDWMRFPNHFRPGHDEEGRLALTEFMREVRNLTTSAEKRLGHSVGIAVRISTTPDFSYRLGMDAAAWAKNNLVDILIPCSRWRPSFPDVPVDEWKRVAGTACSIVPGTDLWIGGMPGGTVAATGMAPIRGFTASMLSRGASGIYLFNHFEPATTKLSRFTIEDGVDAGCTMHDLLRIAGNVDASANGPRRHILTYHDPIPAGSGYHKPLPAEIAPGKTVNFRLHLGTISVGAQGIVRIGLAEMDGFKTVLPTVTVNGKPCTPEPDLTAPANAKRAGHGGQPHIGALAPRMLQFRVPENTLQNGYNTLQVTLAQGAPQKIVWVEAVVEPVK